ncbi:MAG: hypothetical protein HZC28_02275 [Spirochaetes bacterium]|nr:hypothetical protein [Spirochaetota bacterium]
MTAKERVRAALAHREPDRVPIDYADNPGIRSRLMSHFGIPQGPATYEALLVKLNVDFRRVSAPYRGPRLHPESSDASVRVSPDWGIHTRYVEHGSGGYWDYCDFPLRDLTMEQAESYPLPSPDDFDYDAVAAGCRKHSGFAVCIGNAGIPDIINGTGFLMGMEEVLVRLMTHDEAMHRFIERRVAVLYEVMRRSLIAGNGMIDILWLGEDLGTQLGPMVNPSLYREVIRPHHKRFADLAKEFSVFSIIHSCGSSSWAFDDFIDMGIDCVETLQPEAAKMEPSYLKGRYGDKLSFHGCISTTGTLSFGSAQATADECRHILDIMKPNGGYCFAPTHQIQDNTPTENVIAMYNAGASFGAY